MRKLQEKCIAMGNMLCLYFEDLEKAFDRVPNRMLEWVMRRKGIPEVFVRSVMCIYVVVTT